MAYQSFTRARSFRLWVFIAKLASFRQKNTYWARDFRAANDSKSRQITTLVKKYPTNVESRLPSHKLLRQTWELPVKCPFARTQTHTKAYLFAVNLFICIHGFVKRIKSFSRLNLNHPASWLSQNCPSQKPPSCSHFFTICSTSKLVWFILIIVLSQLCSLFSCSQNKEVFTWPGEKRRQTKSGKKTLKWMELTHTAVRQCRQNNTHKVVTKRRWIMEICDFVFVFKG